MAIGWDSTVLEDTFLQAARRERIKYKEGKVFKSQGAAVKVRETCVFAYQAVIEQVTKKESRKVYGGVCCHID